MPAVAAAKPAPVRTIKTQSGQLKSALRYVFYGDNGVGKSTLAAHAPRPIWLDVEDGSGRLEVDRYVFRDGAGGHVPLSYAEILAAIDDLTVAQHDYQTVVIDTIDRLEALMWKQMCDRDKKDSIEAYGFGKGYTAALDEWRKFYLMLDRLRSAKRMSIVLLAHSSVRTFKNPTGDDYDRYQLRIHDKASGFTKEWSDVVGFCAYEEGGAKLDKSDDRAKGWHTGKRFIHVERTAAYDAKSRIVLPPQIELDRVNPWAPLAEAVEAGVNLGADELRELIGVEVSRIGDPDIAAKVTAKVKEAGTDVEALSRYLNGLRSKPSKQAA